MSLLFLDLDNFKAINDTYGHTTGDQVLREMGHLLNDQLPIVSDQRIWRTSDVATRYGGEEFAVLLPNTSVEGAVLLAEQIRDCVTSQPYERAGTGEAGISPLPSHLQHWRRDFPDPCGRD